MVASYNDYFNIGDLVIWTPNNDDAQTVGAHERLGKIIDDGLVEFQDFHPAMHDGDGQGTDGHCWWLDYNELRPSEHQDSNRVVRAALEYYNLLDAKEEVENG